MCASRDPDAKLTYVTAGSPRDGAFVVKCASTAGAEEAVEREGRVLAAVRARGIGDLSRTVPRPVDWTEVGGRTALVSTAVEGTPMIRDYHSWHHTSRRRAVGRDLDAAARWLADFQGATAGVPHEVTWPVRTATALQGRWDGHDALGEAMVRLDTAAERLSGTRVPSTAVHGDYWFGNLLTRDAAVVGVVDWEAGSVEGCPLRDLARFALSYSLYLDRHTRPGRPVRGHRGLRREGAAPGVRYALNGRGWLPDLVRSFLADGLRRLGASPAVWYAVALAGVAEVAASANDDDFGREHLLLLAGLPPYPRRHGRTA